MRDCFAFIACSDSLSVLQAIQNVRLQSPIIAEILYEYNALRGRDVTLMWVPSHVCTVGNEKADTAAKSVLNEDITCEVTLPYHDFKPVIKEHCILNI